MAGVVPNGAIEREDSAYSYAYRDRSKRLQPDSPYQAPDPVIALHPNNLHPAFRANGKAHEPSSEPDGALVESSAPEPLGKHAAPERGPETDAPAPPAGI